jgi:hypothetical protein
MYEDKTDYRNREPHAQETPATTTRSHTPQAYLVGTVGEPGRGRAAAAGTTPPETRRTFERLVALSYTPEDARRLIGNVVAQEIFAVMQRGEAYHEQRYMTALRALPERVV